jgi:hypothetical protein
MTSKRLEAFNNMKNCPIKNQIYRRLNEQQKLQIVDFIKKHDERSYSQFKIELNNYYEKMSEVAGIDYVVNALDEVNGILFERKFRRG